MQRPQLCANPRHFCELDVATSRMAFLDLNQGPLKIWTEHSNFPLQGRGDAKPPLALLRSTIFFEKKCENTFLRDRS